MANLEVKVRITDTDIFRGLFMILTDILEDERISSEIRREYNIKLNKIREELEG